MFLYSVGPSRIDLVIQCDLFARHSLRRSARANTVAVYTDTQKKVRVISFLPCDMMHVHFATRKVAK